MHAIMLPLECDLESVEHHGLVSVDKYPVVEMPTHGLGEHEAFEVAHDLAYRLAKAAYKL